MDIRMCDNKECPSKEECFRFKAIPNPWRQSYAGYSVKEGEDKCDSFWQVKENDNIKTKEK